MFNESNENLSKEIKSYEAKPYEIEYYEARSNEIKSYEIDYVDIKHHKIKFYGVKSNDIKSYEAKPYEVEYYEVRSNEIKSYETDYIDIKPHEIKSNEVKSYEPISNDIESNEDYYIENIKNEFNKFSNNLVEANTKGIRYIVDHINNGENLKETLINLEDIRDKSIAYNDILPFGILSKSSYIDLRKMKIISSVTFDDEYKILKTKSRMMVKLLKALKMPLFLGFLKYISEEELLEEKLLKYIELNKNKVQNIWIDEFKKWLKELRDAIDQKYMTKRELSMKKKN